MSFAADDERIALERQDDHVKVDGSAVLEASGVERVYAHDMQSPTTVTSDLCVCPYQATIATGNRRLGTAEVPGDIATGNNNANAIKDVGLGGTRETGMVSPLYK